MNREVVFEIIHLAIGLAFGERLVVWPRFILASLKSDTHERQVLFRPKHVPAIEYVHSVLLPGPLQAHVEARKGHVHVIECERPQVRPLKHFLHQGGERVHLPAIQVVQVTRDHFLAREHSAVLVHSLLPTIHLEPRPRFSAVKKNIVRDGRPRGRGREGFTQE